MTLNWHIFLQFSKSKFTATTSITSLHGSISKLIQLYSSQLQLNVLMVAKQSLIFLTQKKPPMPFLKWHVLLSFPF